MIEGGWPFVWASYALCACSLGALALVVMLRNRHWARAASKLEAKSDKSA